MITVIEINKYRKLRIWMDELPSNALILEQSAPLVKELSCNSNRSCAEKNAAVELFINTGPRSIYALIGGRLESSTKTDALTLVISRGVHDSRLFSSPFSSISNEVFVGLPEDCATGVVEGVKSALSEGLEFSGTLLLENAAFSPLNSSEQGFIFAANLLTKILIWSEKELLEQDILNLCHPMLVS